MLVDPLLIHLYLAFDKDGLDLIIVPGKCYCFGKILCGVNNMHFNVAMGFDEERNRIGHGKG